MKLLNEFLQMKKEKKMKKKKKINKNLAMERGP